jgi:FtsP/CotA-like multicopper oxidase with cupredoxin domain
VTRGQRLGFLAVAVAIAVVAVIVLVASGGSDEQEATPPAGTATTSQSTATPQVKVPVLEAGHVEKLRVKEGDTVRFRARNDAPEEVHVHGYNIKMDVGPGQDAEFTFKATITGIFEIELEGAGEQIGELRVDPR